MKIKRSDISVSVFCKYLSSLTNDHDCCKYRDDNGSFRNEKILLVSVGGCAGGYDGETDGDRQ